MANASRELPLQQRRDCDRDAGQAGGDDRTLDDPLALLNLSNLLSRRQFVLHLVVDPGNERDAQLHRNGRGIHDVHSGDEKEGRGRRVWPNGRGHLGVIAATSVRRTWSRLTELQTGDSVCEELPMSKAARIEHSATTGQQTLHRQLTPRITDLTDWSDSECLEVDASLSGTTDSTSWRSSVGCSDCVERCGGAFGLSTFLWRPDRSARSDLKQSQALIRQEVASHGEQMERACSQFSQRWL